MGAGLEFQYEEGSPWLSFEVAEVHDSNEYTITWLRDDDEDVEEAAPHQLRVCIQNDSTLQVLNSDEVSTHQWRPEATSLQQLMERTFLDMMAGQQTRGPVAMPSPTQLAATSEALLKEVVTRAVGRAQRAGTHEVTAEMAQAAVASVSRDLGGPPPP